MAFQYDYASMGHVLDTVRGAGGKVSDDFYPILDPSFRGDPYRLAREQRSALGSAIANAFMWRDSFEELWGNRKAVRRHRDLETVAKLAERLVAVMGKDDDDLTRLLSDLFPAPGRGVTIGQGMAVLRGLPAAATAKRDQIEASGQLEAPLMDSFPRTSNEPGGWDNVETPSDAFTVGMQDAFREFFGEPTVHQDEDGEPCGPFVAFVQAVRRGEGSPVTTWAVKKAVDRLNGLGRDKAAKI